MIGGLSKLNRYLLAGAGAIGILAVGIPVAKAQDLKAIQAQIDSMQATIKALQKQVQDAKAQAAAAQTASATATAAPKSDTDILWKGGAPTLKSSDGEFSLKVRGVVQTDYEHANQDKAITSYPDLSATEFRRARLGFEGTLFWDFQYVLEVDFANDATAIKDAYVQYSGVKLSDSPIIFRVGNFKTPNSFESQTSDYFTDTFERSAFISAWEIDRQIGFMTAYWTPHFGLAAGIFGKGETTTAGSTANTPLFPGFISEEDVTFAARGTFAPINNKVGIDSHVLHFGASVRTRDVGDDQPLLTYRARCGDLHMTNFCVNTGVAPGLGGIGDGDTFWGLEAAALWGPFSVQGEYAHLDVDLPGGSLVSSNPPGANQLSKATNPFIGVPDPDYSAWYVQAAWFFGGRQTYDKEGKWSRPVIPNPFRWGKDSGWGGLEIVGKYDVVDLSDSAFNNAAVTAVSPGANFAGGCPTTQLFPGLSSSAASPGVAAAKVGQCGQMATWVIGVNWWVNDHVRLTVDYSQSKLSDYPTTIVSGTQVAGFDGGTIRGVGMRAQVDW